MYKFKCEEDEEDVLFMGKHGDKKGNYGISLEINNGDAVYLSRQDSLELVRKAIKLLG